jgi:hypothetical protein
MGPSIKRSDVMDLTQDPDDFASFLSSASRDCKYARDNFLERIDHWKRLVDMKYGKDLVIDLLPDQRGFTGSILGKFFQINISPITNGLKGGIEAVLTVPAIAGGNVEIDRFFVNRYGNVVESLQVEHPEYTERMSINTLTGVLRAVLDAPIQLYAGPLDQS